jgi:Bacterial SH3 domain
MVAMLMFAATLVEAQTSDPPPDSVVRVANTDGSSLNLRAGPSADETVVARLAEGDVLTVTGPSKAVGNTRWLPVRATGGKSGWVSAQYTALVSAPTPTPSPSPMAATLEAPRAETQPMQSVAVVPALPLDVDARLKYPEARTREQELIVYVTRGGAPVPGAIVTVRSDDGDDEIDRTLDPTDEEGRARRVFSVRREKGTVYLSIKAVAPDGGEGTTGTSFFRR